MDDGSFRADPEAVASMTTSRPAGHGAIRADDDRWGEVGLAVLAVEPGAEGDRATVVEHCVQRLAESKIPDEIAVVEELPRNATGKVLKRDIRQLFVDAESPAIS